MREIMLNNIKLSLSKKSKAKNSMGCSEDYYYPNFMVGSCFTEQELNALSEDELKNLIKLAQFASDVFY